MGLMFDTCVLIRAEKKGGAFDFDQWESLVSASISRRIMY